MIISKEIYIYINLKKIDKKFIYYFIYYLNNSYNNAKRFR